MLELVIFGAVFLMAVASACGGHHHHKRVSHLSCELEEARGALGRRNEDDRTWRPSHVLHRVDDLFHMVEEARHQHAAGFLHGWATPHGIQEVAASFRHGHCEPRHLEHASIALSVDRPGDCDDEVYALLEILEDHHHHTMELWKLVRGHDRDWILDCIHRGDEIPRAIRAAKATSRPRQGGDTGAVRKVG